MFTVLSPSPSISKLDRDNNFNFLRLLFASLVLLSHGPELVDGNRHRELLTRVFGTISFGEFAVNSFFLLSGYLILASWQRKPDLRDFFDKRIRRIYPGFLVAILVSVFLVGPFAVSDVSEWFKSIQYPRLFLSALALQHPIEPEIPPLMFSGRPYQVLNGALWSIPYEFFCYCVVAALGWLFTPSQQRWVWPVLLALFLALLPFAEQLDALSWSLPGRRFLGRAPVEFIRLFCFFAAGACFYLFQQRLLLNRWSLVLAAMLAVASLFSARWATVGLATFGTFALLVFALTPVAVLKPFQRLADVSYGTYLYGWPIQKLLDWYFPATSVWLLVVVAILLSWLAGYISWYLVESHFIRRKYKQS